MLHKLNHQPLIYRIGALLGGCIIIYGVWSLTIAPLICADQTQLKHTMKRIQTQIETFNSEMQSIQSKIAAGEAGTEQGKLSEKLKSAQKNMAIFQNQLIPPKKMDDLLHHMLKKEHLKLSSLKLGHPTILAKGIVEQPITLIFKGTYFDTVNYLKKMEISHWHFFYNHLNYQVNTYPEATITLTVQTVVQGAGGH